MNIQTIISIIVIAVVVITIAIFLIYKIKKNGLRKTAIQFIVEAEKEFEKGKNSEKFNYVLNAVYELLPSILKIFITKDMIVKLIQKTFDEIKVALDYKEV